MDEEKDPKHADKDPNELRIALVQGRSLAVKDKAVLYGAGSSDPRVRFKVTGTKDLHCASKCIKKSLDPSWRETFSLPLTKDYSEDEKPIDFGINGPILEVTCEDIDTVSSADFMGELNLPVFVRSPFCAFSSMLFSQRYPIHTVAVVLPALRHWREFGAARPTATASWRDA